jgi:steroid delta-isomerase-like uncharacterized protein
MPTEDNKTLVRRYLEQGWSRGNISVLDDILAPNYRLRVLQGISPHEDHATYDINRVKQSVTMYHQAFSELEINPQTIVAEDDRVVVEWTARATHTGAFRSIPPPGKQLSYAGINIYRVEGGKIAEEVYLGDRLGLWQQLGLVPASRKLAADFGHK